MTSNAGTPEDDADAAFEFAMRHDLERRQDRAQPADARALQSELDALRRRVAELEEEASRIRRSALTDVLTQLMNRVSFAGALEQMVDSDRRVALIYVDLDGFKAINDGRGHNAGDHVLKEIARRLRELAGDEAAVARISGDEFQLAVYADGALEPMALADRIVEASTQAVVVEGEPLYVSASLGVAVCPDDAPEASMLTRCADIALSHAKDTGKARAVRFRTEHHDALMARRALASDFVVGMTRGEVAAWFQPIMPTTFGRDHGVNLELLARWNHPAHGLIEPDTFIPLAEERGCVGRVSEAVLAEAGPVLAEWMAPGHVDYASINISMTDFQQRRFPHRFVEMANDLKLPLDRLVLEITESAFCEDLELARRHALALTQAGLRLALDDFGTGYSNLQMLMKLPIYALKLDRSMVVDLGKDPRAEALMSGVVSIASAMGAVLVAEGIERPEQAEHARRLGCTYLQGFMFGRPMTAQALSAWLSRRAARRA